MGLGRTKQLFDLGPALLDRIEVGPVGWQVSQFRAGAFDQFPDAPHFVGGEIVHHHNVAGFQLRAQYLFHVGEKDIPVRSRFMVAAQPERRIAPNTGSVRQ